jgi:penicillin amidase
MIGILDAPDVSAGMEILGRMETAWNFVLADRHGNIGYQMSGRMPVRRPGWNGFVPLPGWDPNNDWRGFVPSSDLPRVLNPESGFFATANNNLNDLGRVRPINVSQGSYRADRIASLLSARDDWSVDDTERVQMDVFSLQAERFMAVLRPLLPDGPTGEPLRQWDCRYDLDSRGAYLFEKFYRELIVEVFGSVCGAGVLQFISRETGILTAFYHRFDEVLLRSDSVWFGAEGRDVVFARVAAQVLDGEVKTLGEHQQIRLTHLLLGGRLPAWLGFDYGPVALPGGRGTIHQTQIYRSGGRETSFAPSYRFVTDLGQSSVRSCLAGGPSDRRFSGLYTTGVKEWAKGQFKVVRGRWLSC